MYAVHNEDSQGKKQHTGNIELFGVEDDWLIGGIIKAINEANPCDCTFTYEETKEFSKQECVHRSSEIRRVMDFEYWFCLDCGHQWKKN
jgi:hypothetical protein